jgi:tRNA pseudouridine38-40 synthase
MIRNIVGTLLEISSGKLEMEAVPEILHCKDRSMAGPTAPAEGLYLVRIWY